MARGNRAIRDHEADGKELHLFEAVGGGNVRYIGQAFYLTHHIEERRDANDDLRQAVVFELAVETEEGEQETDEVSESNVGYDSCTSFAGRSMDELRRIALQSASPTASAEERRSNVYCRAKAVKEYVLRRADGTCEGCGKDAPFVTSQGRPYLESHHVRRVSDGGPDHPKWVIALCPNCHRRAIMVEMEENTTRGWQSTSRRSRHKMHNHALQLVQGRPASTDRGTAKKVFARFSRSAGLALCS